MTYIGLTSFSLLEHACDLVSQLDGCGSSSLHDQAVDRALESLCVRGLLAAVAGAACGMAATAALVRSDAGQRELYGPTATTASATQELTHCLENAAFAGLALNKYLVLLAEFASSLVSTDPPVPAALSPRTANILDALADSQLLAAAATVVLDTPAAFTLPMSVRNHMCCDVREAAKLVGVTLYCLQETQRALHRAGGREGQRLAAGLLRAMRHVAVRRLQVALLDQLAAHAGMGAELEGREEDGQQAAQAEGWAGSSGTWWFALEEAKQGRVLGLGRGEGGEGRVRGGQARGGTAGELEDYHCHVVTATLGTWGSALQGQAAAAAEAEAAAAAAAAGVPAGPPPLLVARLAARAAEALVRLCRGEGLGGAYGLAPEWQFAMAQVGQLRGRD